MSDDKYNIILNYRELNNDDFYTWEKMSEPFDNSPSKLKSVCIAPDNIASKKLFEKYGFTKYGNRKCWEAYLCDKDFYPTELKNLKLIELTENSQDCC